MVVDIAGDGWFESLPVYIVILVMGEMDGNGWKWNVWNFSASCASSFHLCRVLWAIAGCTSSDLLETWENSVIHFDSTLHHASIVDSGLQHWQLV